MVVGPERGPAHLTPATVPETLVFRAGKGLPLEAAFLFTKRLATDEKRERLYEVIEHGAHTG